MRRPKGKLICHRQDIERMALDCPHPSAGEAMPLTMSVDKVHDLSNFSQYNDRSTLVWMMSIQT